MKYLNIVVLLVLLVLVVALVGNTEAKRKGKKGKVKAGGCKYGRKGEDGPCEVSNNTKVVSLPLKKGDPTTCQPTKTVSKPCSDFSLTKRKKIKGCKYEKKGSEWTECGDNVKTRTRTMKLKEGSNPQCPLIRTKEKPCRGGNKKASRNSRKDA